MKAETLGALERYVQHRIPTGGFLQAVLENDLMGAMGRADEENRRDIFEICQYVYNDMPGNCHGSPATVLDWLQPEETVYECEKTEASD